MPIGNAVLCQLEKRKCIPLPLPFPVPFFFYAMPSSYNIIRKEVVGREDDIYLVYKEPMPAGMTTDPHARPLSLSPRPGQARACRAFDALSLKRGRGKEGGLCISLTSHLLCREGSCAVVREEEKAVRENG